MSYESLDSAIVQAEAREAREARQARREPPSYHLGGAPEPWERAIGDTTERVGRQGRAVVDYAIRMNTMGILEKTLAGDVNPIADHVASIGRNKMRLLPGASVLPNRKTSVVQGAVARSERTAANEENASISSDESSEFSDDHIRESRRVGEKSANGAAPLEPGVVEDENSDDVNLINDIDIQHAVEDFDPTNWTVDQLRVGCHTLLEESYAFEDRRRRLLSAGMLGKLIEFDPTALRWMQRNLEAVINDGLPSMIKGTLSPLVFKLDILLGVLAPTMSESMTQLNVMARVLRLMLYKMDIAVQVITFRYNLAKELAQYRKLPSAAATHKRMTLLMQWSALRARWRTVYAGEKHGFLPSTVLHNYLYIILALVDQDTCPKFSRMNRIKMVGAGGLLALTPHTNTGERSQRLACRIIRELAREPLLIYELLNAGVVEYLSDLLPKLRETYIENFLEVKLSGRFCAILRNVLVDSEALEALDSMAFSAMRLCIFSSENSPDETSLALVDTLVADGHSTGGLESEIRLPAGNKVEETVRVQLGLPRLMATLTCLLEETAVQLFLAGLVILGKLASTVCYQSVLQEILSYAGRALDRVVEGLQSQEDIVPDMSLAFFLRLCSRLEGRQGIETTDGPAMLRPLISGRHAYKSPGFLRGLVCAVALSRRESSDPPLDASGMGLTTPPSAPSGLSLPRAGGVGRSAPPKPHPIDLEDKFYRDLVGLLDEPYPAPLESVRGMIRMGFLEAIMRFLVRDDGDEVTDTGSASALVVNDDVCWLASKIDRRCKKNALRSYVPHYFHLEQRYACLGAVALHGLVVLAGPHPAIFTNATLQYLSFSIQVAYVDLTVGEFSSGVGYALLFRSIQLACRALAFLATSDSPVVYQDDRQTKSDCVGDGCTEVCAEGDVDHEPLRRVADSLLSTTAIKEVACMAQMPSRASWYGDGEIMYRHLERNSISAAILIASICPVPAAERDPFTRFDDPQDEEFSLQRCQPLMERLLKTVGGSLCSTLMVADNLEIIAHACRALSKLSSVNTTVQILLDSHDLMKAIIRLGPKAPIVFPESNGENEEASRNKDVSSCRPRRAHDGGTRPEHLAGCVGDSSEHAPFGNLAPDRVNTRQQLSISYAEQVRLAQERLDGGLNRNARQKVGKSFCAGQRTNHDQIETCVRPLWNGYEIKEGKIEDASTRKLCSLPSGYFRLVANVARVPTGQGLIQRSGALKRCLERLSLEVSSSSAAWRATLRCRSEICILVARMAGTYDRGSGAANDSILCTRYRALGVMLGMLSSSHDHLYISGRDKMLLDIARHNAAYALAELCQDTLTVVPLMAQAGGLVLARTLAIDPSSPMPLLKHALRIMKAAATFPGGMYASSMSDARLLRAMHRIANNACPGFQTATEFTKESSSNASEGGMQERPLQQGQRPNGGKSLCKEASLRNAFRLGNSGSSEGHLITELARDIAYLLGSTRSVRASVSPLLWEATELSVEGKAPVLTETKLHAGGSHQDKDNVKKGAEATIPQIKPETALIQNDPVYSEIGKETPEALISPADMSGGTAEAFVLGKPGTYLDCGVTSCWGLGFVGEHGNVEIKPRLTKLVRCKTKNDGESESGGQDGGWVKSASPWSDIDSSKRIGNVALTRRAETNDAEVSKGQVFSVSSPRDVVVTPLTMLNTRDAGFPRKPTRSRDHYGLGCTDKVKSVQEVYLDPPSQRKECTGNLVPAKGISRGLSSKSGRSAVTASSRGPPEIEGGDVIKLITCFPIDVAESPIMASTRPKSAFAMNPHEASDRSRPNADKSSTYPVVGEKSVAGKEFVKFARPVAQLSISRALGETPGASKWDKALRLPWASDMGVVGRFACRGYLLDPIFVDQNPVILHPRLPRIVDGRGSFNQVSEGSTLPELVASEVVKGSAAGSAGVGVEPYRNVVEVWRHRVGVSGFRRSAGRRFFDEKGRPLFPVTFHHVYSSVQDRKREHADPHLIPLP